MSSFNCYEDARRAEAYARLEFPGTYYLAYRDLPQIIRRYVRERRTLPLSEALHKMTGRPAERLQVRDRGRIAPRWIASSASRMWRGV